MEGWEGGGEGCTKGGGGRLQTGLSDASSRWGGSRQKQRGDGRQGGRESATKAWQQGQCAELSTDHLRSEEARSQCSVLSALTRPLAPHTCWSALVLGVGGSPRGEGGRGRAFWLRRGRRGGRGGRGRAFGGRGRRRRRRGGISPCPGSKSLLHVLLRLPRLCLLDGHLPL